MSAEHDIRSALRSEADRYDPADDGWTGIRSGVGAARRRRRAQGGALGGLALAGVALAIGLSAGGGESGIDAGPGPVAATTEAPPTAPPTTSEPATTVAPAVDAGFFPGIWPFASQEALDRYEDGDARFEDPVATAEAFARDYVGMLDPVVGEPEEDGNGAVHVELRPRGEDGAAVPDGGASTLVVLQPHETSFGRVVWTVVAAASPNLLLDTPRQGDVAVGGLVEVRGQGTGYEGSVKAEIRQDGMQLGSNLGEVIGITGSMGELGPLALDVAYATPSEPGGAVLVTTDTGLDGVGVPEFTIVKVQFEDDGEAESGEESGEESTGSDCEAPPRVGRPSADEMEIVVFFTCAARTAAGDPPAADDFVAVVRRVPREPGVLGAALRQLVAGPTEAEQAAGIGSLFSAESADILAGVSIADGTVVVDLVETVSNASTSAAQPYFLGEILRTAFRYQNVERVELRLGGSCDAFWSWQQVGECTVVDRDDL